MIKEEKFIRAETVDFFEDLTEEEKAEAEFMAQIAMMIHSKRISMKMNQEEFGELNNVSQTMVSKWESGEYNFTISSLWKIMSALGIRITLQEEQETVPAAQSGNTTNWEAASSGGAAYSGYRLAASTCAV